MSKFCQSLAFLATIIMLALVQGQENEIIVTITSPLRGEEGGSIEITCTAFQDRSGGNRIYGNPRDIVLRRNGVVFQSSRLSQRNEGNEKVYVLSDLQMSDNGTELTCSLSEIVSPGIILEIDFSPIINGFSGPDVSNGVATITVGGHTTITFNLSARPTATNHIEPYPKSTLSVPTSLTVSGNNVVVRDIGLNDRGTYVFVSTNSVGSTNTTFTIEVEYAPIFTVTISEEFQCNPSVAPPLFVCAASAGQMGSFFCDFQSNPPGSLATSISVPDNSSVRVVGTEIIIETTSVGNQGNYTCVATNVIRGQQMVARRHIQFFVGA